jgi:hypothetical protein
MILASQGNEMDFQKNAGFDEMPRISTLHLFLY